DGVEPLRRPVARSALEVRLLGNYAGFAEERLALGDELGVADVVGGLDVVRQGLMEGINSLADGLVAGSFRSDGHERASEAYGCGWREGGQASLRSQSWASRN